MRAVLIVCALAASAKADELYVAESFGWGHATGDLRPIVGDALYTRLGGGFHLGPLSVEGWLAGALQWERDGSTLGLFGGDPKPGKADLQMFGLDFKAEVPLFWKLEAYVRGGPMAVNGDGMLENVLGHGLGGAGGLMLRGRVRALGFLWAPLFFVHRGPYADATLYLEAGEDWISMSGIEGRVAHLSVGFSVALELPKR